MRGGLRRDDARHPLLRRIGALVVAAALVAVSLVVPAWCAASGLWW